MPEIKQQLPMLSTRAAVQPQTYNEDARTVELVWTTGAQVRRFDWMEGPYLEELSLDAKAIRMDRLNSGAPLLANHDARSLDAVIGVVEKAWIDGNQGRATVRFSDREDVAPIINDVRAGILRNISVGYQVHEYEVEKPQERGGMPTYRAVDWEPMELSIVTIPADSSAQIRGSQELHSVSITTRGNSMSEPSENQTPADEVQAPVEAPVAPDANEIRAQVRSQELSRIAAIRDAVRMAKLGDDVADNLINSGASVNESQAEVMRMWSKSVDEKSTSVHIESGLTSEDKFRAGAVAALAHRAGVGEDDRSNEFRGMSLHQMAAHALSMKGHKTSGMSRSEIAGMVLRGHSTSDFPLLLADVANKSLMNAYQVVPQIWRQIALASSVSDFKTINMLKLGSFSSLSTIVEGAEYTQGTFGEEREQLTASTKGRYVQVTRQMIINDDLNGLTRMAAMLGQAAARTVNNDVIGVLTANGNMSDGNALFSTNHSNYQGTGSAISVATLGAARAAMRTQRDASGVDYVEFDPRLLLVPVGKEDHARTVIESTYNTDTTAQLKKNIISGWSPLQVLSHPLLDANSSTAWYLLADPSLAPVVEIAFLDGQQSPYIAQEEEFLTDAVRWKVRMDYGVAANEWRAGYKNVGA